MISTRIIQRQSQAIFQAIFDSMLNQLAKISTHIIQRQLQAIFQAIFNSMLNQLAKISARNVSTRTQTTSNTVIKTDSKSLFNSLGYNVNRH